MARFDGKHLRGKIGKNSYRYARGQQIVSAQSAKKQKRTKPMDVSAKLFGKASTLNSYIRASMGVLFDTFNDGSMVARLNKSTNLLLNSAYNVKTKDYSFLPESFSKLIGFEFNEVSPVAEMFFACPVVTYIDNTVTITIPEMTVSKHLLYPRGADKCIIVLSCTSFALNIGFERETQNSKMVVVPDEKSSIAPAQSVEFKTDPGCLCLVGIAFHFIKNTFVGEMGLNTKEFNPAAILSARITPGLTQHPLEYNFSQMINKRGALALFPSV